MAHNLTLKLRILLVLTAVVMFWAFLHDIAVSAQENNTNNFDEFEEKVSVPDPLEGFNRVTWTLNDRLYFWVLKPVAVVYGTVLPPGVRRCIANAFDNLRTPVRFFNNIFQGKPDNALVELERFLINSTLGVGGFFDIAKQHFGLTKKEEDFGQTLAVYKVKDGPYIVWPILGPSTARDSVGMAVDFFLDPLNYIVPDFITRAEIKSGEMTNYTSMHIGEYEDLKKSALDPYIAVRDAYIQNRQKKIKE